MTDKEMIDWLETECLDLRCVSIPTGGGDDADIGWEVIQHHMAAPKEREVGRGSSPRKAIMDAIRRKDF